MTNSDRAVVVGQATVDIVHSDYFRSAPVTRRYGGKAFNQAVALARLEFGTSLATAVGNDGAGTEIRDLLLREGVGQDCVVTAASGRSTITTVTVELTEGRAQERVVEVATDNRLVRFYGTAIEHVARRPAPEVFLFTFELPNSVLDHVWTAAERFRRSATLIVVNPAPARRVPAPLKARLRNCDLLVPNRSEAESLLELGRGTLGDPVTAAHMLRDTYGADRVCITLGGDGVACASGDGGFLQAAFPTAVADKVGASDVFIGAVSAALANDHDFPSSVQFAVVCAAIAVGRPGGFESFPTLGEVRAALVDAPEVWSPARTLAARFGSKP